MATFVKTEAGTWKAVVRKQGWPITSKTFRTKRAATDWARGVEDDMAQGVYISRAGAERTTIEAALQQYLKEVTPLKKPTTQRSEKITAKHLAAFLGKYSMAAVTNELVASYRDHRLAAGKSNNTVRIELALFSNLFTVAIQEWGLGLTHNPVAAIRKPSPGKGRDRRLTTDEERRLISAVEGHSNPMLAWIVTLAIETAMRQSEILNLRLQDVDMENRVVRLADTKNNSARTIPLSPAATAALKSAVGNPLRPKETNLVFFGEPGRDGIRRPYQFAKIWGGIKRNIGISDLRFHDLRHEAVSRLVEGGLSDQKVALISGHQSMQMLRRYTHLRAEELVATLDSLAKVRAVVFDVYGTIATINSKRGPFARLLQIGVEKGRPKTADDARTLMTQSWSLKGAADFLGIELTPAELDDLERDLETELDSITLYPDVLPTIRALQRRGIKIAVCSNLAEPYAAPIMRLLPVQLDAYAWSFERQTMKPDRALYEDVCEMLSCTPSQVLMVGDTQLADVDGPRRAGMQSILLDRKTSGNSRGNLSTLDGLLTMV